MERRKGICVMSSPRKAEVFPAFRVVNTSLCYQRLWMVYPEISEGYVGVSYTSLEFVHVDKRRLTPSPTRRHAKKYINVKTHTTHSGARGVYHQPLGIAPIALPGL